MKTEKVLPHGEKWRGEKKGDKLTGTLEGIRKKYGGEYPKKDRDTGEELPQFIMDFTTAEGAKTVFCDTVLEGYAKVLKVGTTYVITFMGWGEAGGAKRTEKNKYRNYDVDKVLEKS